MSACFYIFKLNLYFRQHLSCGGWWMCLIWIEIVLTLQETSATNTNIFPFTWTSHFYRWKQHFLIIILWYMYNLFEFFRRRKIEKNFKRKRFPEEIKLVLSRDRSRYWYRETLLSSNFLLETINIIDLHIVYINR